jgi:ABC-type bacteriocin/lantibiotic exporter with double-glycine peptidase domain
MCWMQARGLKPLCGGVAVPLIDVPERRQRAEFDCGAAVYACITAYWEGRGRRLKADPLHGTPPDQLEPSFRGAGYNVLSGEMDVATLRALCGQGWPVACLIQSEGVGHWVVVRGVARGKVHFMDPADGFRSLPESSWQSSWVDTDRRGTVYRGHGLAVWC